MTRTSNPFALPLAGLMVFTLWLPTITVPVSAAPAGVALVQLA